MPALNLCSRCRGFLPPGSSRCVHCGDDTCPTSASRVRTFVGGLLLAASAGTMAVTLMACYGLPPCDESNDRDGDGYYDGTCNSPDPVGRADCDDSDAAIHPDADDSRGDGIDQNCDGVDGIHASPGVAGSGGSASAGSGGANSGAGGAGAGSGGGAGAGGVAGTSGAGAGGASGVAGANSSAGASAGGAAGQGG